jgi:hypothetical protein
MSVLADKDVDSTMAADWAAIQERHALDEPDPEPVSETPVESPAEPVVDRGDGRRPDGKFAPKAKDPVVVEPVNKDLPVAEPVVGAKGQKLDITQAPSTWKPAARQEFAKLPETVRAEIHRRETDALNGQSQLLPDAQFGKSVRSVVEPYRMLIESEGGTPERAIGDLLRTAAQLRMGTPQQKLEVISRVAQQYGVDLRAFAPQIGQQPGQPNPQPPQTFQDPRVDVLIRQMQQDVTYRQQTEQTALEGSVTNWMNAQDAQGQPLRPYVADVFDQMNALVPQVRQANPSLNNDQVLQQAYETAIWGNPEIRPLLIAAQTAPVRDPANQNRVREARRAASVNVPRRASTPSAGKPGTMDETLAETARALGLIST